MRVPSRLVRVIVPPSGSWRVARARISVDLPAPFGPSRPYIPVGMRHPPPGADRGHASPAGGDDARGPRGLAARLVRRRPRAVAGASRARRLVVRGRAAPPLSSDPRRPVAPALAPAWRRPPGGAPSQLG